MNDRTVVVAIDGSRSAWGAFHWAADEAEKSGRHLLVVHGGDVLPISGCVDEERPFGRALLEDAVARLVDSHPTVPADVRLLEGDVAHGLLDLSQSCDLIVIGRGRSGPPSLLLGAVARRLLAAAHCPTVVVPRASKPTDEPNRGGCRGYAGRCGSIALRVQRSDEARCRGRPRLVVVTIRVAASGNPGRESVPTWSKRLEREAFARKP